MRQNLALLLTAVLLTSPVGCFAVGGGLAHNWSAPAPIVEPETYGGVDFSVSLFWPYLVNVGHYRYQSDEQKLTANCVSHDAGFWWLTRLWQRDSAEAPRWWPVLTPVIGKYWWSQSPDGSGLFTGMNVGAGVVLHEHGFDSIWLLTLEYGWLTLHDAMGDDDAKLQTARLTLVWIPPLGF